jgi:hypothetical protein
VVALLEGLLVVPACVLEVPTCRERKARVDLSFDFPMLASIYVPFRVVAGGIELIHYTLPRES